MKRIILYFFTGLIFLLVVPTHSDAATFKDVPANQYYYSAVEWGYQNNIISGDGKGNFLPNQLVTHGQFIKMYSEFYKFNITYDKKLSLFEEYYESLKNYDIYFSDASSTSAIRRGEIAALIMLAQGQYESNNNEYYIWDIEPDAETLINYMFDNKLSNGVTNENVQLVDKYGFYKNLTRAEAIQFFYNLQKHHFNELKLQEIKAQPFTEQGAIIRTYKAETGVNYYVLADGSNYRSVFVYNDVVIGGYESAINSTFLGIPIGQSLSDEAFNAFNPKGNERTIATTPLVDEHKQNYVHAVLWQTKDRKYEPLFNATLLNNEVNQDFLNLIYTDLINEFRAKHDVPPLQHHITLEKASYLHSEDMATNDFFSHTNLNGESPTNRVQKIQSNMLAGENIAAGYNDIFIAHIEWINSAGHRMNMLRSNYEFVGFGSAITTADSYPYYTVNLGFTTSSY